MKSKYKHQALWTTIFSLIVCASAEVHADQRAGGLSYSPDHWPTRWSSAIRQQQNGKFPTRQEERATLPQLPAELEAVSEQDLFYSPQPGAYPGARPGVYEGRRDRRRELHDRYPRQRYSRPIRHEVREAAFAYHSMFQMSPYNGMRQPYMSNPYSTPMIAMDPVLGHPSIGIPMMPGVPNAFPPGGLPYGYPGMWNPSFGGW